MNIALIAHDLKKEELIHLTVAYRDVFARHTLFATGTTGSRIMKATNLNVCCLKSGPFGGDQEIGALVAQNEIDAVFFIRDPLAALAHGSDVTALLRLCDVQCIPVATNIASAELLVKAIQRQELGWRDVVHRYRNDRRNGTEG